MGPHHSALPFTWTSSLCLWLFNIYIIVLLFTKGMHMLKIWKMQINGKCRYIKKQQPQKQNKEETSSIMLWPGDPLSTLWCVSCPSLWLCPHSLMISRSEEERVCVDISSGLLLVNLMWLWTMASTAPTLYFTSNIGAAFIPTSNDLVNTIIVSYSAVFCSISLSYFCMVGLCQRFANINLHFSLLFWFDFQNSKMGWGF